VTLCQRWALPDQSKFNRNREYPYQLRWRDFEMAIQEVVPLVLLVHRD